MTITDIRASHASAIETGFALALEVRCLRNHNAIRVDIAMWFALGNMFAGIGALALRGGAGNLSAVIGRALYAGCLLRLGLIEAFAALNAHVKCGIEIRSRRADWQCALLHRAGTHLGRGTTQWAGSARGLHTLQTVCATRTWFAASVGTQLLTRATLVAAFLACGGLGGSCSLSQAAQLAAEGTLVGLIETMTARAAQSRLSIEVLASWATLLTVGSRTSTWSGSYSRTSSYNRTLAALQLTRLRLVGATGAGNTSLVSTVIECSNGTGHTVGYHDHLTGRASILGAQL